MIKLQLFLYNKKAMKYTNYDKAELHCHLNGSIPINTILKIIDNNSLLSGEILPK